MIQRQQLTYCNLCDGHAPIPMGVVLRTGDEMKLILDAFPLVKPSGYEPVRMVSFETECPSGSFAMVAYRRREGPAYVSYYLGRQGDYEIYEMCLSSCDLDGVRSFSGFVDPFGVAHDGLGEAAIHLANAPRVLRAQRFLADMNL